MAYWVDPEVSPIPGGGGLNWILELVGAQWICLIFYFHVQLLGNTLHRYRLCQCLNHSLQNCAPWAQDQVP